MNPGQIEKERLSNTIVGNDSGNGGGGRGGRRRVRETGAREERGIKEEKKRG